MRGLFKNCTSLVNISFGDFDTHSVVNMEYMFSNCKSLTSINLDLFDTHRVKKMNHMFSGCSSLKIINYSNIDTSSLENIEYMFANCIVLHDINLTFFSNNYIKNAEYMFYNDSKLANVYMKDLKEYRLQKFDNMFLGTPENMVFCLTGRNAPKTENLVLRKKICSVVDCSENWEEKRIRIIPDKMECVEECPNNYKFFDDYSCLIKCPNESNPENFICLYNYVYKSYNNSCSIRDFFLGKCTKDLKTPSEKQKFISNVTNEILNADIYDLVVNVIEKKYNYTIRYDNEVYQLLALSSKYRDPSLVYFDLEECGKKLKEEFQLRKREDILVFKIEYTSPDFKIPIVEYSFFGGYGIKKLRSGSCSELKTKYFIPKKMDNFEEYKHNPNNEYFSNKCTFSDPEIKTDIILRDRMNEYNINNMSLCESTCTFKGYIDNYIVCECKIKQKFNSFYNEYADKYNLIHRFSINSKNSATFWVVKCYYLFFTMEKIFSNICADIILGIVASMLIGVLVFKIKDEKILYRKMKFVINITFNSNLKQQIKTLDNKKSIKNNINKTNKMNRILNLNIKNESSSRRTIFDLKKKNNENANGLNEILKNKINNDDNNNNIKKEVKMYKETTDNELNSLSYHDALIRDKRKFLKVYLSLIKSRQLIFFSFKCKNDYNSIVMKICFFGFIFSFTLFINTLFIDENVLHEVFASGGNMDIISTIPMMVFSALISSFVKNIFFELMFTESNILDIKAASKAEKNIVIPNSILRVSLKCRIYFFVIILITSFIWFYFGCFYTVFKNTQIFALKNSLISFAFILVAPFGYYIIPAFLRILSLQNRKKKNGFFLYILSKVMQIIL